jgi:hypothetical protein
MTHACFGKKWIKEKRKEQYSLLKNKPVVVVTLYSLTLHSTWNYAKIMKKIKKKKKEAVSVNFCHLARWWLATLASDVHGSSAKEVAGHTSVYRELATEDAAEAPRYVAPSQGNEGTAMSLWWPIHGWVWIQRLPCHTGNISNRHQDGAIIKSHLLSSWGHDEITFLIIINMGSS